MTKQRVKSPKGNLAIDALFLSNVLNRKVRPKDGHLLIDSTDTYIATSTAYGIDIDNVARFTTEQLEGWAPKGTPMYRLCGYPNCISPKCRSFERPHTWDYSTNSTGTL